MNGTVIFSLAGYLAGAITFIVLGITLLLSGWTKLDISKGLRIMVIGITFIGVGSSLFIIGLNILLFSLP